MKNIIIIFTTIFCSLIFFNCSHANTTTLENDSKISKISQREKENSIYETWKTEQGGVYEESENIYSARAVGHCNTKAGAIKHAFYKGAKNIINYLGEDQKQNVFAKATYLKKILFSRIEQTKQGKSNIVYYVCLEVFYHDKSTYQNRKNIVSETK